MNSQLVLRKPPSSFPRSGHYSWGVDVFCFSASVLSASVCLSKTILGFPWALLLMLALTWFQVGLADTFTDLSVLFSFFFFVPQKR